jgi:hypothetical protein
VPGVKEPLIGIFDQIFRIVGKTVRINPSDSQTDRQQNCALEFNVRNRFDRSVPRCFSASLSSALKSGAVCVPKETRRPQLTQSSDTRHCFLEGRTVKSETDQGRINVLRDPGGQSRIAADHLGEIITGRVFRLDQLQDPEGDFSSPARKIPGKGSPTILTPQHRTHHPLDETG